MARKLINICVLLALMTGCWGGVLAAAACPHLGCATTAAAPDSAAAHGGHVDDRSDAHSASREDHSGHAGAHAGGHAVETPARDQPPFDSGQFRDSASNNHDPSCAHCIGAAEWPPSRSFEWRSNSFKSGGKLTAPRAAEQVPAPVLVLVREITPAQHAPPGRSDRHLLFSVFRI